MMQKHVKFLFIFFLLFIGAGILMGSVKKREKPEAYEVYANQVFREFAQEMAKEYGLLVYGTGGSMPYGVATLRMMFNCYRSATIEDARELEVIVTEKFVEKINQHKKLRRHLREYPFPASRAQIMISFCKPDNSQYDDGSVSWVYHSVDRFKKDTISYYRKNPQTGSSEDLYEELYPDAFAIVQKKLQAENPPKILRPKPQEDDNYEIYVNQLFYEFAQEEIGPTQESLVFFGQDVKKGQYIEALLIDLNAYQKADIAESKRLVTFVMEKFLERVNQKENLQKYLCERPFPIARTKVVISFCHDDNSRITEGVSEVRYENGEISYYLENPKTGKLKEILREPYKDNTKIENPVKPAKN